MICGNRKLNKIATLSTPLLLIASLAMSQESSPKTLSEQVLQDAYSSHLNRVRKMLPPHSGLPPLLDLSTSNSVESGKDRAWEKKFNGMMGSRTIVDPGAPRASEVTSVATTFIDAVGRPSALPAQECDAVLIAKAVGSNVRLAHAHTYVYSRFSLEVSEVLKKNNKGEIREGKNRCCATWRQSSLSVGTYGEFHLSDSGLSGGRPRIRYLRMETGYLNQYVYGF
jgi:hypothetical protein